MQKRTTSIRGELARKLIQDVVNDPHLKEPIQTGEFRKHPKEAEWICPPGFEYDRFPYKDFEMEYLHPKNKTSDKVLFQLHGGGYIGPMKNIYRTMAVRYSKLLQGGDVLTIDYRVAPEHPYPAALMDAVAAYLWLIKEKDFEPQNIILAGDSAGGGLSLALMMYLRDHSIPLPKAAILMSPWTDLTCSGVSYISNFEKDPLFGNATESMLYDSVYVGGYDPKTPYISPLFGKFEGLAPMLFQAGSYEMLLSDSVSAYEKAKKAGCDVQLSVYEGMFHEFQMSLDLIPESKQAWKEIKAFIGRHFDFKTDFVKINSLSVVDSFLKK